MDWKKQQKEIQDEHDDLGFDGRFGAGLPRVNDGSLLFLQHMVAKFELVRPTEHKHGSRLAIVFSGSPLFSGGAGSGESEIRKWIIENDWLGQPGSIDCTFPWVSYETRVLYASPVLLGSGVWTNDVSRPGKSRFVAAQAAENVSPESLQ